MVISIRNSGLAVIVVWTTASATAGLPVLATAFDISANQQTMDGRPSTNYPVEKENAEKLTSLFAPGDVTYTVRAPVSFPRSSVPEQSKFSSDKGAHKASKPKSKSKSKSE